jgi:DNA-binding response OmpR family regulator
VFILVVEDEPVIQDMVHEAPSEGGFGADMAASGETAITLLQANKGKYRALITDIYFGGKSMGWEVAKRARELNPEIAVVYMTDAGIDKSRSYGVPNSLLLNKPFALRKSLKPYASCLTNRRLYANTQYARGA